MIHLLLSAVSAARNVGAKRNAFISLSFLSVLLAGVFLLPTFASAQGSLVLEGVDATGWPNLSANIYLLDEEGNPISGLAATDILITENGDARRASTLNCPPGEPEQAISSVLTIDVSGSMAQPGRPGGTANIELARGAARAWIAGLPESGSEAAVTAFDDRGVVLHDLTDNREALLSAVEKLWPQQGTNYQSAFVEDPAGALRVVGSGRHKRVIVFLTDGLSSADPAPIIAEAGRLNATIFCVTLGMKAPPVLQEIAEKTGGKVFENVTTLDEARAVYRAILYRVRGGLPCRISWNSSPGCTTDRTVVVSVPSRALSGSFTYRAEVASVPRIQIVPPYAAIPVGGNEVPVLLSAVARPVRIERLEPIHVDRGMSIEMPALPTVIVPGEPLQILARFSGRSGESAVGRWRLLSDGCTPTVITVRAGSGGEGVPLIHLAAPNGGERFRVGDTAILTWDGVAAETPVRLEYSTNAGTSWKKIAENVTGGLFRWRVPGTPSERCLARVSTVAEGEKEVPELGRIAVLPIRNHLYALSAAGDTIVGYLGDTTVQENHPRYGPVKQPAGRYGMWSARTGQLEKTWVVVGDEYVSYKNPTPEFLEFSPDGKLLLCGNYMVDVGSGNLLWWIDARPVNQQGYMLADLITPSFSSDGSLVLLRVPKDGGEVLGVLEARTGKIVASMGLNRLSVSTGVFTPDGEEVLTAARDGVALWNARTGALLRRFTADESYSTTASPDGKFVASVHNDSIRVWNRADGDFVGRFYLGKNTSGYRSARFAPSGNPVVWRDNAPGVIDMATGDTLMTFIERDERHRPKGVPARIFFSPDGSYAVAIGGRAENRTEVNVYDVETGERIGKAGKGGSIIGLSGHLTPNGERLFWSFGDSLVIAPIEPRSASQDISDNLWAIIGQSKPVLADVDFGRLSVGRARDSVITGFVRNSGDASMLVSAISLEGVNAGDFAHVSGVPPFEISPGESRPVEFRFAPAAAGKRVAAATLTVDGLSVSAELGGEGVPELIRVDVVSVNFGGVPVGESRDTIVAAMVRNTGTSAAVVTGVRIVGPDTSGFAFIGAEEAGHSFTIPPGGTYPVALRFTPDTVGLFSTRISIEVEGGEPLRAYAHGRGVGTVAGERFPDPTTFRTVAVPNAVIPHGGTIVAGSYDLLGLMAGYAVTDNVMIIAGGAPPLPDDWGGVNGVMFGAYALGVKVGTPLGDRLNVAAGFQWAQSIFDREETAQFDSRITLSVPYGAVSYGDDDRRASLTAGYAFKRHHAVVDIGTEAVEEFDRNALIVALGGDWRIGDRWKIAAEGIYMKTAGTLPLIATARWFGRTWALDVGAAFLGLSTGDSDAPSIPLAPVVSFVWVMPLSH